MYRTIRNVHLVLASMSLPFLLMYGLSAVQMSHSKWFDTTGSVREEARVFLAPGMEDGRTIALAAMDRAPSVRGEITIVQAKSQTILIGIAMPGTKYELTYDRTSGDVRIRINRAGVMGMLNRLHHAAGFWHEPFALRAWGAAVAIVSVALLLVGATGVWMWFLRRTERVTGFVLLAVNAGIAVTLLLLMRAGGV
jgi:hypothetical protein